MDERAREGIQAEVVLPCADLDATLAFFRQRLGFRLVAIHPADSPAVAVVAGHGLRIRLDRRAEGSPGTLRLLCPDPDELAGGASEMTAPNGTRVVLAPREPPVVVPPLRPAFVVTQASGGPGWVTGRAGMRYRDLLPDRLGGRFIASHIQIPDGGPVADDVHFHRVRFQLIYCVAGWVRVVYEDQGPPFALHPGDAVLQPTGIRHRVLECSPGLQVVEVACPAEHETLVDPEAELPTAALRPDRDFGGQRFARHQAAGARFGPWRAPGFEARDLGFAAATAGTAAACAVRRSADATRPPRPDEPLAPHGGELLFGFVTAGRAALHAEGREPEALSAGDAFAIPAGLPWTLREPSAELELLEVTAPAAAERPREA